MNSNETNERGAVVSPATTIYSHTGRPLLTVPGSANNAANLAALAKVTGADRLAVHTEAMPEDARRVILEAIKAGAQVDSLADALEQLANETEGAARKMAAFIVDLEQQTEKRRSRKPGKKGSNVTPPKKRRR